MPRVLLDLHAAPAVSGAKAVAKLTLNRPEVLNAIDFETIVEIRRALAEVRAAAEAGRCGALIVTGAGRGFCAGADLAGGGGGDGKPATAQAMRASMGQLVSRGMDESWNPMMRELHGLPVPTVSALNGVVAGGGVGVALAADIAVAAPSASFVLTFGPRLGIVPDLGTTWQLPRRAGRAKALGLAMLGDRLDAAAAERMGLIWEVAPDPLRRATEIAARLASYSTAAMVEIRAAITNADNSTYAESLEAERHAQHRLFDHPESPYKLGAQRFQQAAAKRGGARL